MLFILIYYTLLRFEGILWTLFFPLDLRVKFTGLDVLPLCFSEKLPAAGDLFFIFQGQWISWNEQGSDFRKFCWVIRMHHISVLKLILLRYLLPTWSILILAVPLSILSMVIWILHSFFFQKQEKIPTYSISPSLVEKSGVEKSMNEISSLY